MIRHHFLALTLLSTIASACDKQPETTAPTAAMSTTSKPAATSATNTTTPSTTAVAVKETASAAPSDSAPMPSISASASTSATPGAAIVLVPKTSFGPIRLGATKTEIEALGVLKVHPHYSGMTVPYTVYYDKSGKADRIQLSFKYAPGDVSIGTLSIPRTATFADVKKLLGDCKDQPPATGGTTSKCRGGAVNVSIGSGDPTEVWLEAAAP